MAKALVIIGAGGFSQEVRWLVKEGQVDPTFDWEFVGYVVSDLSPLGDNDDREAVVGDLAWLGTNLDQVDGLALGIGSPAPRIALGDQLTERFPDLEWPALIHPSVLMDWDSARIGRGVILCANTVGTVDVELGDFSMVNLACTLGHGAKLGRGCVLNPTVNISGGVTLEDGILVGTGAQVLQYLTIGEGATVGAGALVSKDVPPNTTVVGVPARPLNR